MKLRWALLVTAATLAVVWRLDVARGARATLARVVSRIAVRRTAPQQEANREARGGAALRFPDADLIQACVHCGLCLPTCPTYAVLGVEMDSPRGRIYQMDLVARGVVEPGDPKFRRHIYQCLDCRACETACPSGVQYGRLVEAARSVIPPAGPAEGVVRDLALSRVLNSRFLLAAIGLGSRLYDRSGVRQLVRATRVLRVFPALRRMETMLPNLLGPLLPPPLPAFVPAMGERRCTVAFLTGCVADQFYRSTNVSSIGVLAANGCDVSTPPAQGCCGALANHSGDREAALRMARHNISVFESTGAEYYVTNAAGCGSMMKEYGHLLDGDPEYAERAREFSRRVRDITELLDELGPCPPEREVRLKITYQDACHLRHGQGVKDPPRRLLRMIPGLEFVEMRESDWCCGSAGIYNVTQPELSESILERKMTNVAATGAVVVVASNPGCLIQLEHGLRERGLDMTAVHTVDLLARAYGVSQDPSDLSSGIGGTSPASTLVPGVGA